MTFNISGIFQVKMTPEKLSYEHGTDLNASRMNLDKIYEGALSGNSHGEMLSVMKGDRTAGGYVAIEIFEGSLQGKSGAFALQHFGQFDASAQSLVLKVVPGSGTGELAGISGKMSIRMEDKQHYYDFEGEV